MNLQGTQLPPSDTQFHDSVTGQWSPVETPNSDRRRLEFDVPAGSKYIVYTFPNGILTAQGQQTAPAAGISMEPNYARDAAGGWPVIYVYLQ